MNELVGYLRVPLGVASRSRSYQEIRPLPHTFEQKLLGINGIDTIDPKNIESILSLQFKSKYVDISKLALPSSELAPLLSSWKITVLHTLAEVIFRVATENGKQCLSA